MFTSKTSQAQTATEKTGFIEKARQARLERAGEKKRECSAVIIQASWRGCVVRRHFKKEIRELATATFGSFKELDKTLQLPQAAGAFNTAKKFMFVFDATVVADRELFQCCCRYVLISLEAAEVQKSFVALAMQKTHLAGWVSLMKRLLWNCCLLLDDLKLDLPADVKLVNLYLNALVSITSPNTWAVLKSKQGEPLKAAMSQLCSNILCHLVTKGLLVKFQCLFKKGFSRKQQLLKPATVSAVMSLCIRCLQANNFSDSNLAQFITHILSIPGLIVTLNNLSPETVTVLMNHQMFSRCTGYLSFEPNSKQILASLEGSYALCILGNIIHLGHLDNAAMVEHLLDFVTVVTRLLDCCRALVVNSKSAMTSWHPVLGWFSQSMDQCLQDSMLNVVKQLQYLWSAETIKCLFSDLFSLMPDVASCSASASNTMSAAQSSSSQGQTKELATSVKNLFKKVAEHRSAAKSVVQQRLGSPQTTVVAFVCSLYQTALLTLTQLRYEILSGLCYQDCLLPRLWHFISTLGQHCGLKAFLELLAINPKGTSHEFHILMLFCDIATYLLTIVDDIELYEHHKPFKFDVLTQMAQFMNNFVFRAVWESLIDVKGAATNPLFQSTHNFEMLLYSRDSRRNFTGSGDFWLIRELKPSVFLNELEKANPRAIFLLQKVPHIIPHKERVVLFRKYVAKDKDVLGVNADVGSRSSTLITVHRNRIVEDGYQQMSLLSTRAIKGVVRVKFINAQGLDEPGIDQDGVFKEFLEETVKSVFDPSLNLFKVTSDGHLYPSSTSGVHENHLALFEFVGRILAKAIYEGIVVEVPLATFFINHLLGRASGVTYSSVDELPSLDPELYKNLTYVKHFDGDVSDLELTFSCDEDCMGHVVTHELIPGGRTIGVTNENKISYIHYMAHFRMFTQIKDQLMAFIRGFRSLIPKDWLMLFAAPELQKLISGDTADIDLEDLKKHVQYYGGFHANHRVVLWLWDILQTDFTAAERRLFLKFVTSCSKPPLLGFAFLEPPFSIRCVEVADDQDTGDTLGSVIRGFLAIRKKDPVGRLPTSSTCFNLLKLPNYHKKQTLREKLKYAINSGTGFELS